MKTLPSIGIDIVYIPRIAALITRKPTRLHRLFTPTERQKNTPRHLAGVFAAKEASYKALSHAGYTLPTFWTWAQHVSIETTPHGPALTRSQKKGPPPAHPEPVEGCTRSLNLDALINLVQISISHDGEYATAIALVNASVP